MKREWIDRLSKISGKITDCEWINFNEFGYSRTFTFKVRNAVYVIEWWVNVSYLKCGEMIIPFTMIDWSGTWPHHFKNNLQFTYLGNICAIIPVEEYPQK